MRRLVPALSIVLGAAVVVLSSACSVIDPPALKAGDLTLTRKAFIAELDALAQAPELLAQLGVSTPAPNASVGTTRPSSYDTAFTAAVLNLHLRFIAFDRLAAQFGIEVNPGEEAQAASQVDQLIGTSDTFKSGPGERFRKQLIRMFALFPRVQSKLAEGIDYSARALEFYEARKGSLPVQTCLGLIAFVEVPVDAQGRLERQPTDEEKAVSQRRAQAVYDQLVAGADFEELARGPENAEELRSRAGDLGCPSASDLQANLPPEMVAAIDATAPGEVTVPLDGGFGYEIFKVKSRGIPSFEDVRQEIEQSLAQQDGQRLLDEKLAELAGDLEVTVDPLFGSLNRARGTIEAPGGAAAPPATLVVPTTTSTATVDSEAPLPVEPGGTVTTTDPNSSAVEVGDHA